MRTLTIWLAVMACLAAPALAQEILFADDFETDSALWFNEPGAPAYDERVVDPLDPTNLAIRPWGGGGGAPTWFLYFETWSAPVPVDTASSYVLSFRFLDESPEIQRGRVALRLDPEGPEEYVMPFELIADGSWHEYSFEFVPGALFDSGSDHIMVCLTGFAMCDPYGDYFWDICEGETWNYYDDFRIERIAPIPNESKSWGSVKDLFR